MTENPYLRQNTHVQMIIRFRQLLLVLGRVAKEVLSLIRSHEESKTPITVAELLPIMQKIPRDDLIWAFSMMRMVNQTMKSRGQLSRNALEQRNNEERFLSDALQQLTPPLAPVTPPSARFKFGSSRRSSRRSSRTSNRSTLFGTKTEDEPTNEEALKFLKEMMKTLKVQELKQQQEQQERSERSEQQEQKKEKQKQGEELPESGNKNRTNFFQAILRWDSLMHGIGYGALSIFVFVILRRLWELLIRVTDTFRRALARWIEPPSRRHELNIFSWNDIGWSDMVGRKRKKNKNNDAGGGGEAGAGAGAAANANPNPQAVGNLFFINPQGQIQPNPPVI